MYKNSTSGVHATTHPETCFQPLIHSETRALTRGIKVLRRTAVTGRLHGPTPGGMSEGNNSLRSKARAPYLRLKWLKALIAIAYSYLMSRCSTIGFLCDSSTDV